MHTTQVIAFLSAVLALTSAQTAPGFTTGVFTATVSETAPIGTSLLTVTATDTDSGIGGQLVYSLSGSSSSSLAIDPNTGVITTLSTIDHESTSQVNVNCVATDGEGLSATALLMLTVLDVNDNTPIFIKSTYDGLIKYSSTSQTMEPITLNAVDLDSTTNGQVTYSIISGNSGGQFALDASTGLFTQISDVNVGDGTGTFTITIEARDGGSPSLAATTTVIVGLESVALTYTCRNWMENRGDGYCYKLVRGRKSWDHSQNHCRTLGVKASLEPGNLVTVETEELHNWIKDNLMVQHISVWVGLNDKDTEGTLTWIDGQSYTGTFNNWAVIDGVTQPSGGSAKNCIAIEGTARAFGSYFGKWNDFRCTMKTWSVCSFPAESNAP